MDFTKISKTPDRDLIQLSGYSVYRESSLTKYPILQINNRHYYLRNTSFGHLKSGLDAMTVQDLQTGNISIIYAGTQTAADVQTDADLILTSGTPQQFKDAETYYKQMKAIYGHIDFVAGNSLGGGLANYVAVRHAVHSVTLDPSLLPENVAEPSAHSAAAQRITNYYGGYDPLTHAEIAGGYGARIPGAKVPIAFGISWMTYFANNHTGYLGGTDLSRPQDAVPVGVKGTPSYGHIEFMADRQMVTDIWTGMPLTADTAGKGQRIKLDKETMEKLSAALSDPILSDMHQASRAVDHSVQMVETEGARLDDRKCSLQNQWNQLLHTAPGIGPILNTFDDLKKIAPTTAPLLEELYRLNSLPLPEKIIDAVSSGLYRLATSLVSLPTAMAAITLKMDQLTIHVIDLKEKAIPLLFHGVDNQFMDGIVDELKAHYRIVGTNMTQLVHQISNFREQTSQVVTILEQMDQRLAHALHQGVALQQNAVHVTASYQGRLQASRYLTKGMGLRKRQLETNFLAFSRRAESDLRPVFSACRGLSEDAFDQLCVATEVLNALSWEADDIRIPLMHWDNELRDFLSRATRAVKQAMMRVEYFQDAVHHVQQHLPDLLQAFKPYIETALFNGTHYKAVIAYNDAALGILQDTELAFRSIVYQLSENQSAAIQELEERAQVIQTNLPILTEQVKRGTVI